MVHGPKKVGHPLAENQTWLAPRQKQTSHEGWVAGKIIELIFQPTTFDYKRVYRIPSEMANEPGLTKRLETEAFVSGQSPIFAGACLRNKEGNPPKSRDLCQFGKW